MSAAPALDALPARADAEPDVMVRIDDVSKRFKIYASPAGRLAEWASLGRARRHEEFWALRGVSLDVRRGECVGVLGPNGSGKSTLLKIVTGAMHATSGSVDVRGRVLSLIELGTGLNPLLTGRANIHHAARLLAFPPDFAERTLPEIEAFAELGAFFDREVRLYSSGMKVRLAFSMFACFRPELFIVDEALSVGDVFFKQKCAVRMREMLDAGMTMLFVSHDTSAVLGLCRRAMVLREGRPEFLGEPSEAVSRYLSLMHEPGDARPAGRAGRWSRSDSADAAPPPCDEQAAILEHDVARTRHAHRHGLGGARIIAARVADDAGADTLHADISSSLTVHALVEAEREVTPRVSIRLHDRHANLIFACGTGAMGLTLPSLSAGERLIVRLRLTLDVKPGEYSFGLGVDEASSESPRQGVPLDRLDRLGPIVVRRPADGVRAFHGLARLPLGVTHSKVGRP